MNVKLLRKVKKHILAEPKRLYMSSYIRTKEHSVLERGYPRCGTAACIAGWACIIGMKLEDPHGFWVSHLVGEEAGALLGLTSAQSLRLFEPSEWPEQFERGASDDGKPTTVKVAAARIEHFIKTKGRE